MEFFNTGFILYFFLLVLSDTALELDIGEVGWVGLPPPSPGWLRAPGWAQGSVPPSPTDELNSGFKNVVFKLFLRQGEPGGASQCSRDWRFLFLCRAPSPRESRGEILGQRLLPGIPSGVGQTPMNTHWKGAPEHPQPWGGARGSQPHVTPT